jgi:tetratricopeptide (TPR) repeat protein
MVVLVGLALFARADCVRPHSLRAEIHTKANAEAFVHLGAWFDARRKYECAVEAYRSALKLDPSSAYIFELLASTLYSSGNLDAAVDALRQSINISPGLLNPHLKLAQTLEELHRTNEAQPEWEAALRIAPGSVEALDGMSRHFIAEGNYAEAINLLEPGSLAAARNKTLTLDLAQAYGKSGMLDQAESILKNAIGKHPTSFPLVFALTTVLVDKHYLQEASDLSGKFAASHPLNLEAQRLYLRVLITSRDSGRGIPLASKLLHTHPRDGYFLYANGLFERQAGSYATARLHLQESVIRDPNFSSSHYNLGLVLLKLNDALGAKQQFEEALALGAQEPEVHFQLAKVLKTLGQTEAAGKQLTLYREAADAQSAMSLAAAMSVQAEEALNSGNWQKAVTLYREALQANPDDALLNFKLSAALHGVGDTSGERAALEKAIQIDPDMAIAQNQLGYLDSRSGDSAAAEAHFRQAVRAAPAFMEAWINLAATLGMESRFPEAENAIASALKLEPNNSHALQLRHDLAAAQEQLK